MACSWLTLTSRHPYGMLVSSTLLGVGIGLAFSALGNLIVQAVPEDQTGVASGMNTVLRTLGGALGGQIAATFVASDLIRGLPALAGFTRTFAMAALFLAGCVVAGLLIPAEKAVVPAGQPEVQARARSLGWRPCQPSADTLPPNSRSTSNGTVSRRARSLPCCCCTAAARRSSPTGAA